MSNRPPEIPVSVSLPDDVDDAVRLIQSILERTAEKCNVNVEINIIKNPRVVNLYNQSKTERLETTVVEGTESMGDKTVIHTDRSVINVNSHLNNVRIMLDASASNQMSSRDNEVHQAIEEFSTKLDDIEEVHAEVLELLSQRLEEVTKLFAKSTEQRNAALLKISTKSLMDAVKSVGDIVPGLIKTAETIAEKIIGGLG